MVTLGGFAAWAGAAFAFGSAAVAGAAAAALALILEFLPFREDVLGSGGHSPGPPPPGLKRDDLPFRLNSLPICVWRCAKSKRSRRRRCRWVVVNERQAAITVKVKMGASWQLIGW